MANNHNYTEPTHGTSDWHVPLNANFEQLDRDVEVRDAEANLGTYEPKSGSKFFATDTGNVYLADGTTWQRVWTTGQEPEFTAMNGDQFVSAHPGDSLSKRFQSAFNSLRGKQGTIRITPKPDGTAWQWDQDISLDLVQNGGAEVIVGDDVRIDYTGSGTMLTVDNTSSVTGGHPGQKSRLTLRGGQWRATGSDPDCWVRIKDSIGCAIHPNEVSGFSNAGRTATGVSVENHASYSENTHITGRFTRVDRGIDFVPASVTGGTGGTDSFHDTYLENVHINAKDFGIRLRGKFDYSLIAKPSLFAKADGAACLVLETDRADGTVITGMKCESPGNFSNTVAVKETDANWNDFYPPTIVGGRLDGYGIDTVYDSPRSNPFLGQVWMRGARIELKNWGNGSGVTVDKNGSLTTGQGTRISNNINMDGYLIDNDTPNLFFKNQGTTAFEIDNRDGGRADFSYPIKPPVVDATAYGSVGTDNAYIHHDGSGGYAAGLYYSDLSSNRWVELAGSATIPF